MRRMIRKAAAILAALGVLVSCGIAGPAGETVTAAAGKSAETAKPSIQQELPAFSATGDPERLFPENTIITSAAPTSMIGELVDTDSAFHIKTTGDFDPEELCALLTMEPEPEGGITLTRDRAREYTLTCGELPKGRIVRLLLGDGKGNTVYSWAFQVRDDFRPLTTVPMDKSSFVRLDTGIEVSFTYPADKEKAAGFFEITPAVSGKFLSRSSTLVFAPDQKLESDTVYKVKIKKGLPCANGQTLEEDLEFSFHTMVPVNNVFCYRMNDISESFLPDDPVVIDVRHSKGFVDPEPLAFDFRLYSYKSGEDYRAALEKCSSNDGEWYGDYDISAEGLDIVYEGSMPLQYKGLSAVYSVSYQTSCFVLPEDLPLGWYLADFRGVYKQHEYVIQKLIQISELSVYAGSLRSQAALFINETVTGKPVKNAEITLYTDTSSYKGKTDAGGSALVDYVCGDSTRGIIEIRKGDNVYYDRINLASGSESSVREKYFTYMYSDRFAYLPNDQVQVWGVVLPRTTDVKLPEKVSVRLSYWSGGDEDETTAEKDVRVSQDGTFTAKLDIKNLADGNYLDLALLIDGKYCQSSSIFVNEYKKPLYLIESVVPEYAWLPSENPVKAEFYVRYYDGTPAAGRMLRIDYGGDTVVTDENGHAEYFKTYKENSNTEYSGAVHYQNISCELTGVEDAAQYTSSSFIAFMRDLEMNCTAKETGDTSSVELEAYMIDPSGFSYSTDDLGDEYRYFDSNSIKGEPVSLKAQAVLERSWWEVIPNGTYYDFIQKRNVPKYRTTLKTSTVGKYDIEIKDGYGKLEGLPTSQSGSYSLRIYYEDTGGRKMTEYVSLNREYYNVSLTREHYYSLQTDANDYRRLQYGESAEVFLCDKQERISEPEGRVFFTEYRGSFINAEVSETGSYTVTMDKERLPNVNVAGAYFDGRHIHTLSYQFFFYDSKDHALSIDIATDKETYQPAETARVTLTVKDKDGKPVSGARVLLSTVDKAALDVSWYPNLAMPLSRLYDSLNAYSYPTVYCSYIPHGLDEAEDVSNDDGNPVTGGGIDSGGLGNNVARIRKEFIDTALFSEGVADSAGKASFSVKLPDNITSWAFTAAAVRDSETGPYAGSARVERKATLPVFINTIMLSEYLVGDDITLSASCAGTDEAAITVQVTGKYFNKTFTADSRGEIALGRLPAGNYTALFRAKSANGSDALQLPFSVVESRVKCSVIRTFDLSEGIDIKPEAYPVTLTFANDETSLYCETVNALLSNSGSNLDYVLARGFAQTERGWTDKDKFEAQVRESTSTYGSLPSLYEYTAPDAELASLICAAFPGYVSSAVKYGMYSALKNEKATVDEIVSSYMGLAALGEPVMNEMAEMARNGGYPRFARLKLCAGLAMLGDEGRALRLYKTLTDKLTLYRADNGKIYAYAKNNVNDSDDSIQGYTRIALIAAAALRLPEAEGMARWLNEQKHREYGCTLERAAFLRYYKPTINEQAQVSWSLDGDRQSITLDNFHGSTLYFGEEQFRNAGFRAEKGTVSCTAAYEGRLSELDGDETIKITKKIELADPLISGTGALYKVTLSVSGASSNCCTIEDIIPSCARYAYPASSGQQNSGFTSSVSNPTGQKVEISMYKCNEVSYYVYRVTGGESVIEEAVARDYTGNYGVSERGMMK